MKGLHLKSKEWFSFVGPTFDEQHPSGLPILQIQNDSCTRSAPSVPIRVSACTNASTVLYPDGRNETFGDISLLRLPCNDDNILKYEVIVNSNMVCAFKVKIINGTQPEICFLRTVSGEQLVGSGNVLHCMLYLMQIYMCVCMYVLNFNQYLDSF